MTSVRAAASRLLWYLKEVTGEHDYARYAEHQRRHPHDAPMLSRRQFERRRMDQRDTNHQRCC
jgi:uncharacterized short protein YbdD (DUF466 family)